MANTICTGVLKPQVLENVVPRLCELYPLTPYVHWQDFVFQAHFCLSPGVPKSSVRVVNNIQNLSRSRYYIQGVRKLVTQLWLDISQPSDTLAEYPHNHITSKVQEFFWGMASLCTLISTILLPWNSLNEIKEFEITHSRELKDTWYGEETILNQ